MTESKEQIKELLTNIGYEIQDSGDYLLTRGSYRNGEKMGSVAIYPNTGIIVDFVTGQKFTFNEFIKVSLGLKTAEEVNEVLLNKYSFNINNIPAPKPQIVLQKKFSPDILDKLEKDHSYWINRGISKEVIEQFKGGINKKTNRYCFPIFNSKLEIIGFCSRALGNSQRRYIINGSKKDFKYPLFLNYKYIQDKKEIILVEGIPDVLTLMTCGINTGIVVFGTDISNQLLTTIIKLNPKRIVLAFNNEPDNNNVGNNAAKKAYSRLSKYFDKKAIIFGLPSCKDLNLLLQKQGKSAVIDWYSKI